MRELHAALAANQFRLFYQPTVDLQTSAVTGVEALLRWEHPGGRLVQPNDFIPALEGSGLIVEVGAWVLFEACRQGALWHDAGHRLSVAVNVSARQLQNDRIVDDVREALAASGFDPSSLVPPDGGTVGAFTGAVFDGQYLYLVPNTGTMGAAFARFEAKTPPSLPDLPGYHGSFL